MATSAVRIARAWRRLAQTSDLSVCSSVGSAQIQHQEPVVVPQPSTLASKSRFSAVLIDAAGTLLVPSESTAEVYHRFTARYEPNPPSPATMLARFRIAYNHPWSASPIRYVGDGKPFWQYIVQESTGSDNPRVFNQIYDYFAHGDAWRVAPGAPEALQRLRDGGVRLAVVSNFDTRLRPLLRDLDLDKYFDAIIVSAEVGCEKPNPCIFQAALDALHVRPEDALHVGDDRRNDLWGARDAGLLAWLWGSDVTSFDQIAYRVLHGSKYRQWDEDDEGVMEQPGLETRSPGLSGRSSSPGASEGESTGAQGVGRKQAVGVPVMGREGPNPWGGVDVQVSGGRSGLGMRELGPQKGGKQWAV